MDEVINNIANSRHSEKKITNLTSEQHKKTPYEMIKREVFGTSSDISKNVQLSELLPKKQIFDIE